MALSTIVKQHCKVCGAVAEQVDKIDLGSEILISLKCGHFTSEEILESFDFSKLSSASGKTLMPFQVTGAEFAIKANARVLIGDEQGLGKTVEYLAILASHKNDLLPAVLVTKSAIKVQHFFEARDWLQDNKIQIIFSSKEKAFPGMSLYITSYDMLKEDSVWKDIEPKTLVLDECQKIKNHLSGRAKAVQRFSARTEHIIGLSGTPIMNNAGEYFTILNILQPTIFPEFSRFLREHCDSYTNSWGTKVGGLKNPKRFHEQTKDFIIRRTLADVMPDLFAKRQPRKFHHVELDPKLNPAYEKASRELEELFYSDKPMDMTVAIAVMTRMRQICGVSKTEECADFISDFLEGTDRKISVFAHHHVAVDLLEQKVNKILSEMNLQPTVMLRAGDSSKEKLDELNHMNRRVIICSGIAAGEGMDGLQLICNDMIMLERQWNPAIEEQIESRLIRYGQKLPVNITYLIATGKIDDYFTEIVEQKRTILSSTLDNKEIAWESSNLMKELMETLVRTGKKRWSL